MPLQRRVPKLKGFTNPNRVEYAVVNVETLARVFGADSGAAEVTRATLLEHGLVRKGRRVKVLGRGELDQGAHGARARVLGHREGEDRAGRGHRRVDRLTGVESGPPC